MCGSLMRRVILHAEDDGNYALLSKMAFQRAGLPVSVSIVPDGDEAINYLAGSGEYSDRERFPLPNIVFLDLNMPKHSGFEVLEWVRKQPGLKRLPVVVVTSSEWSGDINHAYELGANSYCTKPYNLEDLVALVQTLYQYWLELNKSPDTSA
jgi:CheY-like chemotaxis protein